MNDISCPDGFGFEVLVNSGGILLKRDQEPVVEQGNYIIFILFKPKKHRKLPRDLKNLDLMLLAEVT